MEEIEEFDLIVVGGGPGGATVATFVAMNGHKVLLLEREKTPIYKIGESLLPATVHGICPLLGVSEAVRNANFVTKLGGTFLWGRNPEPWTFHFSASSRIAGPTATAYQVERTKFDKILLDNAIAKGVEVREQHSVSGLLTTDNRISGVRFIAASGHTGEARARYVVDASGSQSSFYRNAGDRIYSQFFQNVALFGYYEGGGRLPAPNHGNIFCVAFDYGWFWYIPLSDNLTSVGAVIGKDYASKILSGGYESAMDSLILACPQIHDLLSSATRAANEPYRDLRVRKDYSYCNTKFWCPGLVLVGDAACFVDPVFSSGVHLATYSALLAARSINTRLANRLSEDVCFTEFERRYRREYSNFYDFLIGFYDVDHDLDTYFWHARKVVNSPERGNQAFIDLVAGVAGSGEGLYTAEDFVQQRAGLGNMLFRARSNKQGARYDETYRQRFMGNLLSEITQVQLQALLGDQRPPSQPLFSDGLVSSPDGLHWQEAGIQRA